MPSPELAKTQYPHPEGLSRTEAMRDEAGPAMTLVSMYVLRQAAERITSEVDIPALNELAPDPLTAAHEQLEGILEDAYESIAEESPLLRDASALRRGWRTYYRPLFYSFYSEHEDALLKHIEDGFTPQLKLTKNLLLPGYMYAKHGTSTPLENYPLIYTASVLESQDFKDLLIHTSKTGNQLWGNGARDSYSADILKTLSSSDIGLLQPAERQFTEEVCALYRELYGYEDIPADLKYISINTTNICTTRSDGTVVISPYARKYLHAYLRMSNNIAADKESSEFPPSKVDCFKKTSGCPVTIKSGHFPFHLIPLEVLQDHFGAETEIDGTVTVPGIMIIAPEGDYKYINASPAVLALNGLYADRIRNIAA